MDRGLVESLGLGSLYGTTTFLPISSGGHLRLVELLFNLSPMGPLEELALLFGTLGATLIVVRQALVDLASTLIRAARQPRTLVATEPGKELSNLAVAQIPILVLEYWTRDGGPFFERQPLVLAFGFSLTVCLLLSTARLEPGQRSNLANPAAALTGLAHGVASLPGLSSSACTIVLGLWFGLSRRRAFEFALLVSIPGMVVRMLLLSSLVVGSNPWGNALLASVASLASGIGAAVILRATVLRGQLVSFTLWVAPLAVATFALARAWPGP